MIVKIRDILDWISVYLIPRPIWLFWYKVRHPVWTYHDYLNVRWAKSIKVGDVVCDCACKHVTVAQLDDDLCILDDQGHYHDLIACCSPVKEDNSCHSMYLSD